MISKKITLLLLVLVFALAGCGSENYNNDNEDGCGVVNDGGMPAIWFTYVPPYGSHDDIEGQVSNVLPNDYKVAVYINVGGWWTKPYWSRPKTDIDECGDFTADITTGGVDQTATEIRAYLIPADYDPPLAYGGSLPDGIEDNAVAIAIAER